MQGLPHLTNASLHVSNAHSQVMESVAANLILQHHITATSGHSSGIDRPRSIDIFMQNGNSCRVRFKINSPKLPSLHSLATQAIRLAACELKYIDRRHFFLD
jgi:hypothetical protein